MAADKINEEETFDWLNFRKKIGIDLEEIANEESFVEKLQRRFKENPFVPIGALATVGCLTFGLISFRRGDKRMSQLMMRARVIAQGFTVAALVAGVSMVAAKKVIPTK